MPAFSSSVPLNASPSKNHRTSLCAATITPTASVSIPTPKRSKLPIEEPQPAAPAATPQVDVEVDIILTDAQWRDRLSPAAYVVLRHGRTEWPFTSPLLDEKRAGVFKCAGCDSELFDSRTKYSSGTGWPSFWRPLPDAIRLKANFLDRILGQREVSCAKCEGHLGHVFRDGPPPTGERYCINGVALDFETMSE